MKRLKKTRLYFPGDGKDTAIERLERLDALMLRCHYVTAPCDFFGFRDKRGSPKTRKFVWLGALTPRLPSYYMSFRLSEILQLLLHEPIRRDDNNWDIKYLYKLWMWILLNCQHCDNSWIALFIFSFMKKYFFNLF